MPGRSRCGVFDGGGLGYQVQLTVGYPEIHRRWQWRTSFGYRHLDSDATPDAFNDSDFHLGGTNAKGYIFAASLGVAHNVDLTAKWLSAKGIFAAGADNLTFEKVPSAFPAHVHLLVESGIHIIEVLNLEPLACDKVWEFLFIAQPLKIRGGTGSPIRPVAVVL